MPRICLSSEFPSRVNFRLDYTTQMTVHKATDELKNFLSPVASFFKEPSKSRSGATRARTDSVPPGHLCSKTASGASVRQDSIRVICAPRQYPGHLCSKTASSVSRSMPSSIGPFLSPQFRVLCSHRSCSMVVFSGGFGQVYPRQCVSTEVLKQGSQMAQALNFWKDVIICLFMYTHVCTFV